MPPDPDIDKRDDGQKPEETKDSSHDLLVKIASKGPIWLRAGALLILLLTAVTPYWERFEQWLDDQQLDKVMQSTTAPVSGNQPYAGGTQIAAPKDAPKLLANSLSVSDAQHLSYHISMLLEKTAFKRLLVAQKKGMIAYSVFASDGCILINHVINGHIKVDLVRAEEAAVIPPTNGPAMAAPVVPKPASLDMDGIDWNTPKLKMNINWGPAGPPQDTGPNKTPVQGSCMNPHPGQFQYWAVPVGQCVEQVFRRFGDGCTHYQMHNPCNNYWDPAIHWTFCVAQHGY